MKYKPHDYQKYAIDFIKTHTQAAVLLECGLGKTSVTLTALNDLMFDSFEIHKVLIIAPIRVCRNSWAAEIEKWDHLDLSYSLVLGTREQRIAALKKKADLYIINRENVQWLIEDSGMPFDFDMIQAIIDYRTALKNLSINYNVEKSQHMKSSVERFFRSEWFDNLSDLDGEFVLKKIREGVE